MSEGRYDSRPDTWEPAYDATDFLGSISLNARRFGYGDEVRAILENTARELGFVAAASSGSGRPATDET